MNLKNNNQHFLYRPTSIGQQGKLLVFLCGGNGTAATCKNVFPVAAQQGYHVIGLTYPTGWTSAEANPRALDR